MAENTSAERSMPELPPMSEKERQLAEGILRMLHSDEQRAKIGLGSIKTKRPLSDTVRYTPATEPRGGVNPEDDDYFSQLGETRGD